MKQAATHWPIFVILVCVFLVCACAHVLARARMSDGGALASDSARVDLDAELDALCAHAWQQLKNLFHRYEGSQRLEDGLQAVEPGNILRYKISPLAQEECEEDDGGLLSRTASHLLSRTASADMPQYLNGSPRASASTPEGANRSISPTPSFSGLRRTPSSQQLKALQHFAEGGGGTPKQTAEAMEAERLQELENKWQAAGVGDDPVGIREFLTYCLHRNVFELFFSLISSTIAKCSFLSERQAHERHTKQLLHHVHDSEVLVSTSQQKFQHSAQDAVMNMIRQYLAGPGEVPSDARADVKRKLQELMDRVVKTYAAFLTKHPAATYWEMQVPPAGDIVRFKKILDPRIARDEMNNKYEHLREECMNVMGKEFLVLAVSERLAVVQVLDSMGIAGQLILKPTYCPSPVQSAPCLVVAAPGSGRSTTIARALKEAKRLPPSAISEEGDAQELVFDGIVAGAAFLRYVGVSSCSNDGQSLLRSLVLEMRSVLQPDSCLAHPIPSSNAELVQEFVHCLRLASVECPIIVMIDGIEKLPQGDPIRELLWMPLEMPLHSRLIVGVSPAFCSHRILSLFRPVNVLHLEECSNYEMQSYIQGCHSNLPEAHKKAVSDFVAGMSIKSLTLTSLLCQHLLHVALGMPNEGVGPLPLRIALGAISLDEEALSAEAQGGKSHEDAHDKFLQVDMDNETLISCTALVPIEETVSSCAVSSSTAPRVSLGLQDGHVVLWDAVLNEWSHRWIAHEDPVLSISFVHALDDSGSRDNGGRGGCVTWMLLTCSQREVAGWNLAVGHGSDRTGQLLFRCNIAADATPAPDMAELASFENAYYQGIQRCTRCNLLHRIPAPSAAAAPSTPRGPTNSRRVAPASGADTASQLVDGADTSILDTTEDGCTPNASQDCITCLADSNVCGPGSKPHVPSAAAGAAETFSCLANMATCTCVRIPQGQGTTRRAILCHISHGTP